MLLFANDSGDVLLTIKGECFVGMFKQVSPLARFCRCFDDESTSWSEELFKHLEDGDILHVPAHWPAEVTNALRMAERRGRIAPGLAEAFLEQLAGFAIQVDPAPAPTEAKTLLQLSRKHRLTVYDAIYLE